MIEIPQIQNQFLLFRSPEGRILMHIRFLFGYKNRDFYQVFIQADKLDYQVIDQKNLQKLFSSFKRTITFPTLKKKNN